MPARFATGPRGSMRLPQDQPPYGASPGPPIFTDQLRAGAPQLMPPQRLGPAGHPRMPPMSQNVKNELKSAGVFSKQR